MTVPMFGAQQEQATSDDRYTPEWIFDELGIEFDLDVASPPGGVPWIPAKRFYSQADDGLAQPWHGTVWCNPPFSNPLPWCRKLIQHGDGILLGPISANATWCSEAFDNCTAFAHVINIRFAHEDGKYRTIPTAVGLFAFGTLAADALRRSGKFTSMVRA